MYFSTLISSKCVWGVERTIGGDVGEALVLTSFPLAITDVEVDVDRSGESLVPIGRDFNE